MPPVSLRQRALLVALLGLAPACGAGVATPAGDGSVDAPADAATDAPTDAATTPDGALVSPPVACERLPEIASPANLVTAGVPASVTRYAVERMITAGNSARPSCASAPAQDGDDHLARFTAPTSGHWRLTARGDGLRALSASRNCNATRDACAAYGAFSGERLDPTLELEVDAQQGETFAVVLDGCVAGRACEYALVAERVGPLACPGSWQPNYPCAEAQRCVAGAGDAARFTCVPTEPLRLASGSLRVSRADSLLVLAGRLNESRYEPFDGVATAWVTWLDARNEPLGRENYLDLVHIAAGSIAPVTVHSEVPAGAVRARVRVTAADPGVSMDMGGLELAVEELRRGAVGEPCDPAAPLACAPALRCEDRATRANRTCVPADRLEIAAVRAWRNGSPSTLRLSIAGLRTADEVSQARIELLGAAGEVSLRLAPISVVDVRRDPSGASFEAWADPTGIDARVLLNAARVRVTVIDTSSRESAAVEGRIESSTRVGVGVRCSAPSVSCDAGLECAVETNEYVCAPARPLGRCYSDPGLARWAPAAGGEHAVQGLGLAPGGITACAAGRSIGRASLLFVAPTTGRYRFETEGVSVLEVKNDCEAPVCVEDARAPSAEVDLRAGDEVPVTVLSMEAPPFALRVRVP